MGPTVNLKQHEYQSVDNKLKYMKNKQISNQACILDPPAICLFCINLPFWHTQEGMAAKYAAILVYNQSCQLSAISQKRFLLSTI